MVKNPTKSDKKPLSTIARKRLMIEALQNNFGLVTQSSKIAGIHRDTHYAWYDSDEKYRKIVDAIPDMNLDLAESKLKEWIDKGDKTAILFYLKTKGRNRGFIERSESQMEHIGASVNYVIHSDKDDYPELKPKKED